MTQHSDTPPSLEQIKAVQGQLERQLEKVTGVMGVGIGFDRKRRQPNLKVMVQELEQAQGLPRKVEQIEVEYEAVGNIHALDN